MRDVFRLSVLLPLLAACASTTPPPAADNRFVLPVAARLEDGTTLTGISNPAIKGGYFEVATEDGSLRCSGPFDTLDATATIYVPVDCSDGRHGRAIVTRRPDGMGGHGIIELSNGQTGRLEFGAGAAAR